MEKEKSGIQKSRRKFIGMAGAGFASFAVAPHIIMTPQEKPSPQTTEESEWEKDPSKGWFPVSDRKLRVGLVGYGYSKFSAAFGFQNHPNVEITAVSDLIPERCAELAKVTKCNKTYPSLEELVKDDKIEAVFVATDPPNHPKHCIDVLKHGKHVATAVPVTYGSIEEGEQLLEEVEKKRTEIYDV